MRWFKRDLWKAGIVVAGMLLLLVLTVGVSVSAAGAHQGVSEPAMPGTVTVQATPIEDATVTALNKEKLAQEVQQLQEQNEPDFFRWLRTNAAILLSTLVVVVGGLIGLFRWFGDRRSEREKRVEERFQAAVTGLGDEKEGARIGAAIVLRTFLRPGYEQFYTQTFDLAVAHLRLRKADTTTADLDAPILLDPLNQALITVFKESFPRARQWSLKQRPPLDLRSLDATFIRLDNAYLYGADLKEARMRMASLQGAHLFRANLTRVKLKGANFTGAYLDQTNLTKADLDGATLIKTNIEAALSLEGAKLHKVKGLTQKQWATCKDMGAIIDEDSTTHSSQPTITPSLPSQSNDAQASPIPSAQGSPSTSDAGGSSGNLAKTLVTTTCNIPCNKIWAFLFMMKKGLWN